MNEIISVILRTALAYAALLVLARILGKKQMSELTFFHYITGITMGDIAGSIISSDGPVTGEFIGLAVWCALTVLVGEVNQRSGRARTMVEGQPAIIIRKGQIDRTEMRKCRITMDDVTMLLRERDVFSVLDVEYAILETNGQLSVLKKQEELEATKKDVKAKMEEGGFLPCEIIVNGKINRHSLRANGLDEQWLKERLGEQGIAEEKEVLYAELQKDGSLHVQKEADG